jgi:hypothetical protein
MREALHDGNQGRGNPYYTHRLNTQDYDTTEDTPPVTPEKAGSWAIYAAGVIAFVLFTLFAFRLGMPNVLG